MYTYAKYEEEVFHVKTVHDKMYTRLLSRRTVGEAAN